jgi:PAS domain S-box-containing protein
MHWQLRFYITLLIIAIFVTGAISIYSWRRRQTSGATSFACLMLAVAVWSLGYALELWHTDLDKMLLWVKVGYLGVVSVPVFWLAFALEYSGREKWLSRRNLMVWFIIPLIILLLNWTNPFHKLYYATVGVDTSGPFIMLSFTKGVWYWVSVVYSYLLLLTATVILVNMFIRSSRPYRDQIGIVLVGAFIPWIANVLYIFGLNPLPRLNLTPLAFTLTGLVMTWGLFRFKLLDIVPVARDKVMENMSDGVIVLDALDRIVDINPAAQKLIDRPLIDIIGQSIEQILVERPDLIESYRDLPEAHAQIVLGEGAEQRYYDLHISPLYGRQEKLNGRLIVLHDITERQQAEETLQALNRRMQDELALAHEIQQGLLPLPQPDWPQLDVVCYSVTARELGGDFYRYHAFPNHEPHEDQEKYAFAIGDVSGKGVSAALLMAASASQFDATLSQNLAPPERLAHLDIAISPYTQPRSQNCALCYIELDLAGLNQTLDIGNPTKSATLHIVNAGCIPPYIRRKNGTVEWPKVGGFALGHGIGARIGYEQETLNLSPGDLVILTSDGVAEAVNVTGEMFGFDRLAQAIANGPTNSATDMLAHLKAKVVEFTGQAEPRDDMTIVVVQV